MASSMSAFASAAAAVAAAPPRHRPLAPSAVPGGGAFAGVCGLCPRRWASVGAGGEGIGGGGGLAGRAPAGGGRTVVAPPPARRGGGGAARVGVVSMSSSRSNSRLRRKSKSRASPRPRGPPDSNKAGPSFRRRGTPADADPDDDDDQTSITTYATCAVCCNSIMLRPEQLATPTGLRVRCSVCDSSFTARLAELENVDGTPFDSDAFLLAHLGLGREHEDGVFGDEGGDDDDFAMHDNDDGGGGGGGPPAARAWRQAPPRGGAAVDAADAVVVDVGDADGADVGGNRV